MARMSGADEEDIPVASLADPTEGAAATAVKRKTSPPKWRGKGPARKQKKFVGAGARRLRRRLVGTGGGAKRVRRRRGGAGASGDDFLPGEAGGLWRSFWRGFGRNDVLMVMLAVSLLLHVGVLGLFWGIRLISGGEARKANLASQEFLIDLSASLQPTPPPIELPRLKPPPGPVLSQIDPAMGAPINVLTVNVPSMGLGLPSAGADLQSRMLGSGGLRDSLGGGLLGRGAGARTFSLGGGTVRASAIIVMLDASGSMQADRKMDRAREKMRDLARRAGVRVVAEIEVPNCAFVQIAEPGAGLDSPIDAAYAMSAAMRKFPAADAIYFFSDFQDMVNPAVVEQLRLMAMEMEPHVAVYLHTLEEKPDPALDDLCRATGGQILK